MVKSKRNKQNRNTHTYKIRNTEKTKNKRTTRQRKESQNERKQLKIKLTKTKTKNKSRMQTSYVGIFLVLSGVRGLLLVFSWCSVRIVPSLDVFLMHLWREMDSMSSYSSATLFFPILQSTF